MSDYEERLYDIDTDLLELVDHIEMEHEREIPHDLSKSEIRARHNNMHEARSDWSHTHEEMP